jgi:hypothetical protein
VNVHEVLDLIRGKAPASKRDRAAELEQLALDYRATFATERGQRVFVDLLDRLGFMRVEATEEDRILGNVARGILRTMGVWDPVNKMEIVRALLLLPSAWRSLVVDQRQAGPEETEVSDGNRP